MSDGTGEESRMHLYPTCSYWGPIKPSTKLTNAEQVGRYATCKVIVKCKPIFNVAYVLRLNESYPKISFIKRYMQNNV